MKHVFARVGGNLHVQSPHKKNPAGIWTRTFSSWGQKASETKWLNKGPVQINDEHKLFYREEVKNRLSRVLECSCTAVVGNPRWRPHHGTWIKLTVLVWTLRRSSSQLLQCPRPPVPFWKSSLLREQLKFCEDNTAALTARRFWRHGPDWRRRLRNFTPLSALLSRMAIEADQTSWINWGVLKAVHRLQSWD